MRLFLVLATLLLLPLAPAYCELHIHPHASVIEEYDSNITFDNEDEISDTDTRMQAGLDAEYLGKFDTLKLSSYIFRRFYNSHSEFDATSYIVRLDYDHEFTRYDSAGISERFHRGTEPTTFEGLFGRAPGIYRFITNELELDYSHEFTSQLKATARYGNILNTYSREDISDNVENYIGGGVEYAVSSRDYLLADYKYDHIEYDPGGAVQSNTITGGVRHYFSSQLYLEGIAGWQFLENVDDDTSADPVYRVTLSDQITDKLEMKLTYLWEYTTSAFSTDVYKNRRWSFTLTNQVTDRLKIDAEAFWGNGEYTVSRQENELVGGRAGFLFEFLPHWLLTSSVNYTQQTSTDPGSEYTRTTASVGLRVEF